MVGSVTAVGCTISLIPNSYLQLFTAIEYTVVSNDNKWVIGHSFITIQAVEALISHRLVEHEGNTMNHSWRSLSLVSPILSLGLLLAACNSGGTPPQISDLPASLALAAKTGVVIAGEFSFKNTGGSTLGYTTSIPASATWLGITAGATGSVAVNQSQTVKASATCPATPATLEADVKVASSSDSSIFKNIKVTLVCTAPDITPDSFSLSSVNNAELSTDTTSNEVTISGIDTPAAVAASNGATVIINNSTALVGTTVKNGDKLKVILKSSALFATTVSSNMTVGTFSTSFTVTTKTEPKLSLAFDPAVLSIKQGGSGSSNVAVVRDGFTGDVSISTAPTFVADGITVEPLTITSDKTTGILKLVVAANATVGQRDVPLIASGGGKTASAVIKVTVTGSGATPITSGGYANIVALVGKPIAAQIPTIMGGTTPYKVVIDSALPAGLTLDAATGGISGTPTAAATLKTYTITISDSSTSAQSLTKTLDVTVNPALSIKTVYSSVNGTIGFEIKKPGIAVVEGGIPPYSYSIAPTLPTGITLDAASGKIGGKPTVLSASIGYTVAIKDSDGTTVTSPVKVSVNPVPSFTKGYQSLISEVTDPEKLPQTPELTGGALPLGFTISPDLTAKTGIVFDAATGMLSGAPTKPALEEKYTVVASDENGASAETTLRVLTIPRFAPKVTNTSIKESQIVNTDLKEIKINFNKNINASLDSMSLVCGTESIGFDGLPIIKSSTTTLLLKTALPQDSICVLAVLKNKVADLLDPPLNMAADFVLSFQTDAAPDVTAFEVVPGAGNNANGRVGTDMSIKVSFTEPVDVVAGGMTLVCGIANITFTGLPASNSSSIIIKPIANLPQDTTCTLTVLKDKVSDTDTADLPDNMNQNRAFTVKTDAAPDAIGIETTVSSDVGQPDRVAVTSDIKINFSESVSVVAADTTLVCDNVNVAFSGLPSSNSSSVTIDPTDEMPQDAACVLTVAKAGVGDSDSADLPDNMNQDRVFSFKTEALFGFIDLKMAFDPAVLSYEDNSSANPNARQLGTVRLQNLARSYDQSFSASQLIQVPNGSFIVTFLSGSDANSNEYPASGPATLVVAPKATVVLTTSFKDPTVVRNTNDSGADSLRALVASVQPATTITFLDDLFNVMPPKTIILTSGEIAINNKNVNIFGPGAGKLTVKPDNSNMAANAPVIAPQSITPQIINKRVFNISGTSVTAIMQSFTVRDGRIQDYTPMQSNAGGGCIVAKAATTKLTLTKMAFVNCWAAGYPGNGGAVLFEPNPTNNASNSLVLNNVVGTGNCAVGTSITSIVCNPNYGTLAVSPIQPQGVITAQSGPDGGYGGMVCLAGAKLTVNSGTYTGNHAADAGGAIYALAPNDGPTTPWINLQGGSYINNVAGDGGAVYISNSASYNIISAATRDQQRQKATKADLLAPQLPKFEANASPAAIQAAMKRYQQQRQAVYQSAKPETAPIIIPQISSVSTMPALEINTAIFKGNIALYVGGSIFIADLGSNLISNTIGGTSLSDGNSARDAGGIYAIALTGSKITMKTNEIVGNSVTKSGGGIFTYASSNSSIDLTDNIVTNNHAGGSGAGIYTYGFANSTTIFTYNTVNSNTAKQNGGGIYSWMENTATASFTGNTVNLNTSAGYGGVFTFSNASNTFTNNTISDNKANTGIIGGAYAFSNTNNTFIGNNISDNSAGSYYGGVYAQSTTGGNTFTDNIIGGNSATGEYGGIYSSSNTSNTFIGNNISENTAVSYGGVFAQSTTGGNTFTDNIIGRNKANTGIVGGVYALSNTNNTFIGNNISGNEATAGNFGGVYVHSTINTFTDNTIGGNSATSYGGILASSIANTTFINNTISSNRATAGDYGGLLVDSTANIAFINNTISGNSATGIVGGVYAYSLTNTFNNNTISGNSAGSYGGVYSFSVTNTFNNNTISGNSAGSYGGVYSFSVTSNAFTNNTINGNKAATGSYGGIYADSNSSNTFTNNTISGNMAAGGYGGTAVFSFISNTFINNTISGNKAATFYGGLYASSNTNTLKFNTIYNNTAAVQYGGLFANSAPTETGNLVAENTAPTDPNSNVALPNSIISTALAPASALAALAANNTTIFSGAPTATAVLTHLPTGPITSGAACDPAISTDQRGKTRPTTGSTCAYGAVQP
jgi:hypothetical protein